jgi:predicted aspartyl protease
MGRFTTKVTLKGTKEPKEVDLIVDTGSPETVINKKLAEELGLIVVKKAENLLEKEKPRDFRERITDADIVSVEMKTDDCPMALFHAYSVENAENILGAKQLQELDAVIEPKKHKLTIRRCWAGIKITTVM